MGGEERAYLHFSFAPGQCIKDNRDGGSRLIIDVPECDADAVNMLRRWRDGGMVALIQKDDGHGIEAESEDEADAESNRKARRDREARPWP